MAYRLALAQHGGDVGLELGPHVARRAAVAQQALHRTPRVVVVGVGGHVRPSRAVLLRDQLRQAPFRRTVVEVAGLFMWFFLVFVS